MAIDLRKLQSALLRHDVAGIYQEVFQPCDLCEYPRAQQCTAPGCKARFCTECMKEHAGTHLYDDPATERVQ